MGCVFCERIAAGQYELGDEYAVAFAPLRPVTDGHLLVLPRVHAENAATDPQVTASTMRLAAEIVQGWNVDFNLITSAGAAATQTVMHLHIHIVPRRPHDGLALPWTARR
jgi:histidine triad (HIT) family protein